MPRMLWMVLMVWIAAGQTQIDLSTQAKNVPIKSGASLPGTCAVGQLFFLSSAPTGANLYGCTAVNSWSAQGGQGTGGSMMQGTLANMPTACTVGQTYFATDASAGANLYGCSAANTWTSQGGSETVNSNGVRVGSRPITNFLTGAGLISVITDTGAEINIESALDTAVVATLPGEQTGSSLLCGPTNGTPNEYACSMTPTATAYTVGMVLHWIPDINGAGGPTTLNVDSLGAASVKQADGVSDPGATDIIAGSMREVWYDGINFRFLGSLADQSTGGGSGLVQSVFGRTGAVTAASGDYAAAQVTNAAATNASNTFTGGSQDFSGAAHTLPAIVVSSSVNLPATCKVGELAFVSGAVAGQQIYECSAANTWTQQVAGSSGGGGGSGTAPVPVFGAYATRPACSGAATGQFFWASDLSFKKWVCDGSVWQPVAFDMQVVEPTTFTWTGTSSGSGSPTVTNVAGAVQLSGATGGGVQTMSAPVGLTAPYTIEVAFTFQMLSSASAWWDAGCGFGVTNAQTAAASWEIAYWYPAFGSGAMYVGEGYWNPTFTNRSTNWWSITAQPAIRAKIVDDGTNRTFYTNTGGGWMQLYQESNTTGISSPGYWGVGCQTYNAGDQFQLTLYHASVHH